MSDIHLSIGGDLAIILFSIVIYYYLKLYMSLFNGEKNND